MTEKEAMLAEIEELKQKLAAAEERLKSRKSGMRIPAKDLWLGKCSIKTDEEINEEVDEIVYEIKIRIIEKHDVFMGERV